VRVDVAMTPLELTAASLHGRTAVVIDVFRATTTIAAALWNGARAVVPFGELDQAVQSARQFERDTVLLAGERLMHAVDGFDLGNSPAEFTPDVVRGKTIVLTTTNGTRAFHASDAAAEVFVGSFVNQAATTVALVEALEAGRELVLVCAGSNGTASLEDSVCAGAFVAAIREALPILELNDAAQMCERLARDVWTDPTALGRAAEHGRRLTAAGFGDDVAQCLCVDAFPVRAVYRDRAITAMNVPHDVEILGA
jgi:2-phosphosulfolactate phosphatase